MGKNPNHDMNKNNFITKFGLEKCKEMCEELTNECMEILKGIRGNTANLEELTLKLLNREN